MIGLAEAKVISRADAALAFEFVERGRDDGVHLGVPSDGRAGGVEAAADADALHKALAGFHEGGTVEAVELRDAMADAWGMTRYTLTPPAPATHLTHHRESRERTHMRAAAHTHTGHSHTVTSRLPDT